MNPHSKLAVVVDYQVENLIYQFVSGNVLILGVKHGLVGSGPSIPSENAARNILVADGHGETKNGQVGQYKITAKIAAPSEMSTHRGAEAQYGSPCL